MWERGEEGRFSIGGPRTWAPFGTWGVLADRVVEVLGHVALQKTKVGNLAAKGTDSGGKPQIVTPV